MTPKQIDYIESEEFVEGFRCLALEVPWIVSGAIHKLEEILKPDDIVLEVGSGGSTFFFANRCERVVSIETSQKWFNTVCDKLAVNGVLNVECHVSLEDHYMQYVMTKQSCDDVTVFLVDPQGGNDRSKILNYFLNTASNKLRIIILDNYSHPGEFPLHYDKILDLGEGWEHFDFNHERWAGSGTRIYVKK